MVKLVSLDDESELHTGAVIRMYNVNRFDIIKKKEDRSDRDKQQKDYYDYMIVDINTIKKGAYILINVTSDNSNRGSVFCLFENIDSSGGIKAKVLKSYFGDAPNIFFLPAL